MKDCVAVLVLAAILFIFTGSWLRHEDYVYAVASAGMGAMAMWLAAEALYWQGRQDALRDAGKIGKDLS